jgi:hypothetical protein
MTSPALSDILKHPFYVCSVAKRLTGVAAMVIRIVGLSVRCWSGQQAVVLFQHHDIIVNSGGSPNQGTALVQQLVSQHLNCYTKRSDPLDEVTRCWAKVATKMVYSGSTYSYPQWSVKDQCNSNACTCSNTVHILPSVFSKGSNPVQIIIFYRENQFDFVLE